MRRLRRMKMLITRMNICRTRLRRILSIMMIITIMNILRV